MIDKVGDKLSGHVEYRVVSKLDECLEVNVMRRYSDFLWVYGQLLGLYPGCIIPPVPDKQAVGKNSLIKGRFQEEFIESRRKSLEYFASSVLKHRILRDSDLVKQFFNSMTFAMDKKQNALKGLTGEIMPMVGLAFPPIEGHEVLKKKKEEIDALESRLIGLGNTLDLLAKQRNGTIYYPYKR